MQILRGKMSCSTVFGCGKDYRAHKGVYFAFFMKPRTHDV